MKYSIGCWTITVQQQTLYNNMLLYVCLRMVSFRFKVFGLLILSFYPMGSFILRVEGDSLQMVSFRVKVFGLLILSFYPMGSFVLRVEVDSLNLLRNGTIALWYSLDHKWNKTSLLHRCPSENKVFQAHKGYLYFVVLNVNRKISKRRCIWQACRDS